MDKAESLFWGMTILAALYLLGGNALPFEQARALLAPNVRLAQVPAVEGAPSGNGHFMPDGTWMEGGMHAGCGMGGGGGCGCGGGR